jgi:hypothetical protein
VLLLGVLFALTCASTCAVLAAPMVEAHVLNLYTCGGWRQHFVAPNRAHRTTFQYRLSRHKAVAKYEVIHYNDKGNIVDRDFHRYAHVAC